MFENIKKKLNNPNNLTFVFYGATFIVLLERIFSLGFTIMKTMPMKTAWNGIEYTLALLLPIAGFAYFSSSKYAKNTNNKVKMYFFTYGLIAILFFCMIAQMSNSLAWFILNVIGIKGAALKNALQNIPGFDHKLYRAVRCLTLYFPICIVPMSLPVVCQLFDSEHPLNKLKSLSLAPSFASGKRMTAPKCDVKICSDLATNKDIIIPEERRMETILIQGATGTGKTSTLLLPMCAQDLELKRKYKDLAKDVAMKALEKGIAFVNAPYDNESLNKYFSLKFIEPIQGKEDEFYESLGDLIKCKDPETGKYIFRDLGITVLEPDGKYIEDFKTVAHNLGIDVYSIDPMDPNSLGINPFINKSPAKVASIISTVLKGMYESENPDTSNAFFGQVTQQALENLSILLKLMYPKMHNGEIPTLEDMLKMLYDYSIVEEMCEEMKKDPVLGPKHNILIKYFERNFYNPPLDINGRPVPGTVGSNRRETEQFLYGATTQLDNLMRNKAVRRILCSRNNNIDLDRVLSEGHCISVCTRRGELGGLLSRPFGMFYILTMQDAVLRRPGDENTRLPHFMYIDEFPDFVNKETETCFTLFRKYRCAMTIAIQNLSQLERTRSMKFYKEVVTSNSKTVVVFGDTNKEDSAYWSKAFGRHEYWDLGTNLEVTPLANVTSPNDAGLGPESLSMKIDFTENIKPWMLNELPFRHVFYRTRTAKGDQIFGRGVTDFIDKKYLKETPPTNFDFEKYESYNPNISRTIDTSAPSSIIDQERYSNEVLTSSISHPLIVDNNQVIEEGNRYIDSIEYVNDIDVEIEK
ncbi:MAG: TraM recognition domain-containing protein [Clostridia bacterium]|nr:TraM recognition domain-containing protein [Clostridia bacterium]